MCVFPQVVMSSSILASNEISPGYVKILVQFSLLNFTEYSFVKFIILKLLLLTCYSNSVIAILEF